ncbi:Glutathione S-transferase T3 [Cardamine amara subsp. amara]|uniref:Glutathione S-transferase T3 n=1 Tax=Cardamine amara subsp. amara TaxID=228776 RepID=A0ABD1AMV4_CARAN
MGSSNPNRFGLNFMDLLSSQQEPNNLEILPSFSPSIEISSSEVPHFSSQNSDAQNIDENAREARHRWTALEDVVLISAWLNTSKDPIVGNEQKAAAFWERIAAYYAASAGVADKPKRGASQCKQRWKKINESANKFVGCYSQASTRRSSGQSEDDVLQMAYELYFNDHQVKFNLEHAWLELRHDQKWSTSKGNDKSKRTKLTEGGTYSSSSNTTCNVDEEACRRPPGVKASKGKAKKSGTSEESEASSLLKFERMWALKEKDTGARERLSKQRLLDSLIAKTDLSEPKLNLKNKLIAEMLG